VWLDGVCIADSPAFADSAARDAAIEAVRVALTPIED
jgi:tryptophanyl-tRNA synthetase